MKAFLVTEYTDAINTHLISIGLAAETGETFYAEVPYPDEACSAFVRKAVLPLLGRHPHAQCRREDLATRLTVWLESVRVGSMDLAICFDDMTDWDLFADALDYRTPDWVRPVNIGGHMNELRRHFWHQHNRLPEHHALHDALANQAAYRHRKPTATAAGGK